MTTSYSWVTPSILALFVVLVLDLATFSYSHLRDDYFSGLPATYREVGELVAHDPNTILLTDFYGYPLTCEGEVSGAYWPHWFDFRLPALNK
jgi:hypothetical protein